VFLAQSIYSDYCAVYATAMALSLAGVPTTRRRALSLFNAKTGWQGATHAQISEVLRNQLPCLRSRWRHWQFATPVEAALQLRRVSADSSLTLVTGYCRLRKYDVVCGHAFVVTGYRDGCVLILDSLGKRPSEGEQFNARISVNQEQAKLLVVDGSMWDICLAQPISVIRVVHAQKSPSTCA
jgi:hypothetical protein